METRITKLLGCKYPMIQGGMAWIAESTLASAVSNAGAVGLIAGGSAPIDYLREQIRTCKEKTQNPFGVNIMLMSPTPMIWHSWSLMNTCPSSPPAQATPASIWTHGRQPASR